MACIYDNVYEVVKSMSYDIELSKQLAW